MRKLFLYIQVFLLSEIFLGNLISLPSFYTSDLFCDKLQVIVVRTTQSTVKLFFQARSKDEASSQRFRAS